MAPADEAQSFQGQEYPPAQTEISPLSSLRARLTLIMILALIPAGIFLVFDVLTIRRDVRAEAQADLLRLSQVAAKSYGQQLDEAHRLMAAIALFPEVHGDSAAACAERLGQMVALNQPKYQGFAVVNLDGTVLCSSPQITATVQLADRLWFSEAVRTRRVCDRRVYDRAADRRAGAGTGLSGARREWERHTRGGARHDTAPISRPVWTSCRCRPMP